MTHGLESPCYNMQEQIQQAFPDYAIHNIAQTVWSGQNNDVILVNGDTVFRFPKYQFGVDLIESEVRVLNYLRPHITLAIPEPRFHHVDQLGNSFIGFPLLPGSPLTHERLHALDDNTQQRIADQLANYLCEIHTLPVDLEMFDISLMQKVLHQLFDIPIADLDFEQPVNDGYIVARGMFDSFQRYVYPHIREDARAAMTAHFEAYFNRPDLYNFEPSWRHGDFGGENILFDGENVSGLIDFNFTGVGDPALDIAAISMYGERFFEKLLKSYPEANVMWERAEFYRGIFIMEEALHGILHNDPIAFQNGIEGYI